MAQEHPAESRVPRTGQEKCWDSRGRQIHSPQGTGQDGELKKGERSPDPRFIDNQDGTVTDNLTKLIWLKNADALGELKWEDALGRHAPGWPAALTILMTAAQPETGECPTSGRC